MTSPESYDEARMTNDEGNPNDEIGRQVTGIRNLLVILASSLIRHSVFDIRHLSRPYSRLTKCR